ncbi:unnamed protein product [Cylindrotheca closterium]|uniref:Uncharacterized protein n=1 Tax=Cylindrotheca closterium TaxID=2856 RepID=A0AAD2JNX9_9STRA|nr:unnamed protein product [Cylindrotheca closterium]
MVSFQRRYFLISCLQLLACLESLSTGGNEICSRRNSLKQVLAGVTCGSLVVQPASAKYSDYSRREKDWQDRKQKNEVTFSSARDLKAQLKAIAPMNAESSSIFCPNGPSANVSPLMENKCGDRLATPSVFGRQDDVLGNSIPGFKEGYFDGGSSSSMSAQVGGFPSYNSITSRQDQR